MAGQALGFTFRVISDTVKTIMATRLLCFKDWAAVVTS